jgi:hypothetical protein
MPVALARADRLDLRIEMAGALDRACEDLRKKRNEKNIAVEPPDGGHRSAINVDDIGDGLEGVETDADRQRQIVAAQAEIEPDEMPEIVAHAGGETRVLEEEQHAQIGRNREKQKKARAVAVLFDGARGAEIDQRRRQQHGQIPDAESRIENETEGRHEPNRAARVRQPDD